MQDAANQPTILLLGGSGFVGSALGERFASLGWKVHLVTRTKRPYQMAFPCEQFVWDGTSVPLEAIEGVQAAINLAGQPIFDNRWTADYKKKILDSRLLAGRALVAAIDKLSTPPPVVIQISGTDFYGMDPRSDVCDECAGPGEDFMAEVGMVGEEPSLKLDSVTRLCIVRMGLVLGWEGGGLPQLWDVYASGCGGKLGNGQQPTNWVHVDDVVGFCEAAILNENYQGVYNLVAPNNANNAELHRHLCTYTPSLQFLTAPKLYLKVLMGEQGNFLLQAPQVTTPRAKADGYTYRYPDLGSAMKHFIQDRQNTGAHFLKLKQWLPLTVEQCQGAPAFRTLAAQGWFRTWSHEQLFHPLAGGTLVEDRIEYGLPLFPLGQMALAWVRGRLQKRLKERRAALAQYAAELNS